MGSIRWVWNRLTAMRTAVVLLVLVALAAVPGSLLPQRNVASDPAAVDRFVEENPEASAWLDRLGLFDVYASPWFAATYLLLLVSMTGCVVPRCLRLWREVRQAPPAAPRHLDREEGATTWRTAGPVAVLDEAERHLRQRRFRVLRTDEEVRAERGHVREAGNLVFHLSLLVLLVGVAVGRIYGYEGRVAMAEGGTFTNVASEYDAITPSVATDTDDLEPLSLTLRSFEASFETSGSTVGEPRDFDARLDVTTPDDTYTAQVRPNQPLEVDGTKFFLTGHGYAPDITVTDPAGTSVFSGPVIFLPSDGNLTSDGVIKIPDLGRADLGLEGVLLPTAGAPVSTPGVPAVSFHPALANPRLDLTAWAGDLGLDRGPQSVYALDTSAMRPLRDDLGTQLTFSLRPGESYRLPDGSRVTFDGVARFANFQVARDPGKGLSLAAALLLLGGLTISLSVRRRRIWVRVQPGDPARVSLAARSLSRRSGVPDDLDRLRAALDAPTEHRPEPRNGPTNGPTNGVQIEETVR